MEGNPIKILIKTFVRSGDYTSSYKTTDAIGDDKTNYSRNDNMIHFVSKSTIQHHSNSSLYPNTDAEEAEANQLYENLLGLR